MTSTLKAPNTIQAFIIVAAESQVRGLTLSFSSAAALQKSIENAAHMRSLGHNLCRIIHVEIL